MMWWLCSWLHLYVVVLGLLQAISAHLYDSSSRQKNDLLHSPLYEVHIHEDGISDMLMSNVFTMNGEMGYRSSRQLRAKKDDVGVIAALDKAAHSQVDYDYTLQLHKCRDSGEAYSAAYLISKEHLIHQFTDYNLTWVNCEMGSFIMMNKRSNPERNANGTLLQSLDVLDFSVIHLSAYERLQLRWARSSQVIKNDRNNLSAVITAASILRENTLKMRSLSSHLVNPAYEKTVVVMPFLGSDMGAGHSKLSNRQSYIAACFWSFHEHYSHIVAMVKSPKDRDFIRNVSGLPFYDVILLENLPKSASLPVATVQTTKRLINEGTWNFDYMFFTESDQVSILLPTPHFIHHR